MCGSSSTIRIVCRRPLFHLLVRAAMPLVERWRNPARTGVVPMAPGASPPEAAQQDEPEQHEEEDRKREAEAPWAPIWIRVGRGRHALRDRCLSKSVRQADVVGDD